MLPSGQPVLRHAARQCSPAQAAGRPPVDPVLTLLLLAPFWCPLQVPYGAHVDIRDTVNYKNVMKQYSLGPNGAILTSLNLFATRFDQARAWA